MKKLLVVVDMQKDFIDGALGTKEAVAIVPAVVEKIEDATLEGRDIVFTRDTHFDNYMNTQEGKKLPVPHCIKDTEGWQICVELAPYTKDKKIFDKITFGSVELMEYVKNSEYDDIELIGLCTDICVISNAMLIKAALPEAKITVIDKCMAGVTPASHLNAIEAMKMCQIEVI